MAMSKKPLSFHYQAYILRLWREGSAHYGAWRFSLEDTSTGERRGFSTLTALIIHLQRQIEAVEGKQEESFTGRKD